MSFTSLPSVRNLEILAFAQTEIQSTGPCGYILAQRHDGELVTAWYRLGDSEWCHGNYFHPHMMKDPADKLKEEQAAYADFMDRVRRAKRIPKTKPTQEDLPALLEEYAAGELKIAENAGPAHIVDAAYERRDAATLILEDLKANA